VTCTRDPSGSAVLRGAAKEEDLRPSGSTSGGGLRPSHAAWWRQRVHARSRGGTLTLNQREPLAQGRATRRNAARSQGGDPRQNGRRERGNSLEKRDGSLGSIGYPVVPRGFGRTHEEACVTPRRKVWWCGRGSSARGRVRASLKCVAEVGRRCPDPKKLAPGTFLTKTRARVNGGLASSLSRGRRTARSRRQRRRRAKKHREPGRGGEATRPAKGEARRASTAVTRRAPRYARPSHLPREGTPGRGVALFSRRRGRNDLGGP